MVQYCSYIKILGAKSRDWFKCKKYSMDEKKIMLIAAFGAFIEFYDFTIFGFYSIYFGQEIFPETDRLSSMMSVYIVFALGFLCKPIGLFIAQKLIDKTGAKRMLINTILIMGICSLSMGLIPGYTKIGITAGILMLVSRVIQGLASGGEIYGIIRYINQNMPSAKVHHTISGILLGTELGGLCAIVINQILNHSLHHNHILSIGWRIPFFIGGLLSLLFYLYRFYFYRTHKSNNIPIPPITIRSFVKQYSAQMLILGSVVAINSTLWVNCIIYMPIILHHEVEISYIQVSSIIFNATIYGILLSYLIAILCNKMNPLTLLKITLCLAIPGICYSYYVLEQRTHISIGADILIILHGILATLTPRVFINKIFPPQVRLSGIYLSVNLSYTLFGVCSPLIIICLTYLTHKYFIIQAGYASLVAIISLIGLAYFHKVKEVA